MEIMRKGKKQRLKASAAATQAATAKEFVREPLNKSDYVENEPLVLLELINIEFSRCHAFQGPDKR